MIGLELKVNSDNPAAYSAATSETPKETGWVAGGYPTYPWGSVVGYIEGNAKVCLFLLYAVEAAR
jgi:hypothetical protein